MKKPNSGKSDPNYDVGYGKPPKANQFPKGRTGNPKGRTRGNENIISIFKRVVSKRVKIRMGDEVRSVTVAEAVILANSNAAMQGNSLAMGNMFRLAEASGEFIDRTDAAQVGKPLLVPEKLTLEEFFARHGLTPESG
jgi:hypothetical protein